MYSGREGGSVARHRSNSNPNMMSEKERLYDSSLNDPADIFAARSRSRRLSSDGAQRPLVDYAKTVWRYDHRYVHPEDEEPDCFMDTVSRIRNAFRSPHLRRNVLIGSIFLITILFVWNTYIFPSWLEDRRLSRSLSNRQNPDSEGLFGSNVRSTFSDMIHIKTLDKSLLPGPSRPRKGQPRPEGRRLIFVGDVHGCKVELSQLLEFMKFNKKTDHLVFLGDLVTKGPDSLGVIDLAMDLGATSVRGNHDDRVLLAHRELKSTIHPIKLNSPSSPIDTTDEHRVIASRLTNPQLHYLTNSPVILQVGRLGPLGNVFAVHAGLVPGLPLTNQDPFSVMNMRSIDLTTHAPSKFPADESALRKLGNPTNPYTVDLITSNPKVQEIFGQTFLVPWTKLWNKYQELIPSPEAAAKRGKKNIEQHATVIYGHDSKRGLQIHKWTKGLDSGCFKGGRLSALVVEDGGRRERLASVQCKDYRRKKTAGDEVGAESAASVLGKQLEDE